MDPLFSLQSHSNSGWLEMLPQSYLPPSSHHFLHWGLLNKPPDDHFGDCLSPEPSWDPTCYLYKVGYFIESDWKIQYNLVERWKGSYWINKLRRSEVEVAPGQAWLIKKKKYHLVPFLTVFLSFVSALSSGSKLSFYGNKMAEVILDFIFFHNTTQGRVALHGSWRMEVLFPASLGKCRPQLLIGLIVIPELNIVTRWMISLPGFSVHGIFQARILEWVAVSFSR